MSKWKKFFSSTQEDLDKRARLFRQAIFVALVVGFLGSVWIKIRAASEWEKSQKSAAVKIELVQSALANFIENPKLGDTYQFSAKRIQGENEFTIFAEIIKVEKPNILFRFSAVAAGQDSLMLSTERMATFILGDSLKMSINNIPFYLTEIKSYDRKDGASVKPYNLGKKHITLFIRGQGMEIEKIESIIGETRMKFPLPYVLEKDKTTFQISRENGRTEFRIEGKDRLAERWARRVVIQDWKTYIFLE